MEDGHDNFAYDYKTHEIALIHQGFCCMNATPTSPLEPQVLLLIQFLKLLRVLDFQ